jgi:hypothetical protein
MLDVQSLSNRCAIAVRVIVPGRMWREGMQSKADSVGKYVVSVANECGGPG